MAKLLQGLGGGSPAEGWQWHEEQSEFCLFGNLIYKKFGGGKPGTVQLQDEVDHKGKWVNLFVYSSVFPLQG